MPLWKKLFFNAMLRSVGVRKMPQNSSRPLQVGPLRTASAEVVEMRIAIHRQRAIARHADRDQTEIAELRRRAVLGALADVAARAIAFLFVVEKLQAVKLGFRQLRVASEIGVVLAGVRIENFGRLLEGFERLQHRLEGGVVAIENVFAECRAERIGVRRGLDRRRDPGRRAAHFERRQQRNARLIRRRGRPGRPTSGRRSGPASTLSSPSSSDS